MVLSAYLAFPVRAGQDFVSTSFRGMGAAFFIGGALMAQPALASANAGSASTDQRRSGPGVPQRSPVYGPKADELFGGWSPVPVSAALSLSSDPASDAGWTFERLMRDIVTNNPRIRALSATARSADYETMIARWQYFPTPSVQAETFGTDRQIIASVSQPLLSFGRLATDMKAAQARAGLARGRVDESRFNLSFRVLDLYAQYMAATRAAEVMRADVGRLSALGEMISRRVTTGLSAPVDLNLVLARLRQSENAIIGLEARRASALAGLAELLGKPLRPEDLLLPDSQKISATSGQIFGDSSTIIEQSLGYNPVLRRTQQEVELAGIDRQRAANALKPTVSVRLEQRFDNGRYDTSSFPKTRALFGVQYSFGSGLCDSLSNKEIARRLEISEPTVKVHAQSVFRKIGARNRTHAALIARQQGFS